MARRFGRKPTPMKPLSQAESEAFIANMEAKSAARKELEDEDIENVPGSRQSLGRVGEEHLMQTRSDDVGHEGEERRPVNYHFTRRAHRYYGRGTFMGPYLLGTNLHRIRTEDGQIWFLAPHEFSDI